MADNAVIKETPKIDSSKMWIGGLVLVIVILLVARYVYMKRLKDKEPEVEATKDTTIADRLKREAPVTASINTTAISKGSLDASDSLGPPTR